MEKFLELTANEALKGVVNKDGGPFGAIIVDKDNNIIAQGHNEVLSSHDPTAHAEIVTIRKACKKLNTSNLTGYIMYSNCEPCPMCLSAIIWSNIKVVYYSSTKEDAAKIGFRDELIYNYLEGKNDIIKKVRVPNELCEKIFNDYKGELY